MDKNLVFYATFTEDAEYFGLPSDAAGTLYVGVIDKDELFWFDNYAREWHKSLFKNSDVSRDPDFARVSEFDNGYVTTKEAIERFSAKGESEKQAEMSF